MIENLAIFSRASDLAKHAQQRHGLAAENIANADTPDYKARDIPDFQPEESQSTFQARRSRPGHGTAETESLFQARIIDAKAESPNGNSVSLEEEMLRSADADRSHDLAMTLYRKSLDLLRLSVGGRR